MNKSTLMRMINFWPPLLGAGIKVIHHNADSTSITVEMKLKFWNRNYVGTHFGGSLYAMTDPFYMLMLIKNLGPDYIVWDKSASIRFKRPGKGKVTAHFELTPETLDQIRRQADSQSKVEPHFKVLITDSEGAIVAEVDKGLYVRRKDKAVLRRAA